jgi:hypothetical protein
VELDVGAWVWLRLLHRTALSLDPQARRKLGPRYAGPFQVLERVGKSPTDYSFRPVPGSIKFFTWGCSSLTEESRRLRLGSCRHFSMAASFRSRRLLCVPSSAWGLIFPHQVARAARRGRHMGAAGRVSQPLPRLPARGRAVCAGGERCYDRQDLWAAPSTWLGARAGLGRGPWAQYLIFIKS